MLLSSARSIASVLAVISLLTRSAFAFDTPLSDQAVREAYFLGQRHDASLLNKYIKLLPPSKTGPHISSIAFLTPFAQLVQLSDRNVGSYSAQQPQLQRRERQDFVPLTIQ